MAKTMALKAENDMIAYVRSLAEKRGRNADWAAQAVKESVSITAEKALDLDVIDFVADNTDDLINKINGFTIKGRGRSGTIQTSPYVLQRTVEDLRESILKIICDPNIAYILMMIGLAGLYLEFSHPGAVFPGVVGATCLVLAFYAFQALPVNYAGMLLIVLGLIFLLLEIKIPSFGLLALSGLICLTLGSIFLFRQVGSTMQVSWSVFLPTILITAIFFLTVTTLVVRAQFSEPITGEAGLIGETGRVIERVDAAGGRVFIHGEYWNAHSRDPISEGEAVIVTKVVDLTLTVKHMPNSDLEPKDPAGGSLDKHST
ncbi:MAG: nodulation protein NfeD [Deltaproteobacteria bacterium]|nr:nodulation protein NfeD [Deltaproteobacteria bacterium]